MTIDWEEVAKRVGDIRGDTYSTPTGRRALEIIVGEDNVRDAVDYWISQAPGCFTAESVLSVMRPKIAMNRCYEIYKAHTEPRIRGSAVFLLASFAEDEALPWVREFLDDGDRDIRWNGLGVLRTILYGPLGDAAIEAATQLLSKAEQDSDPEIRERAKQMRLEFRSKEPYVRIWQ